MSKPYQSDIDAIAAASRRDMDDMIEQTYAVLESRGAPRRIARGAWIEQWLRKGKTPQQIADIALRTEYPNPFRRYA